MTVVLEIDGPEAVGKTTLINRLFSKYKDVAAVYKEPPPPVGASPEEIIEHYNKCREEGIPKEITEGKKIVFQDRGFFSTLVYQVLWPMMQQPWENEIDFLVAVRNRFAEAKPMHVNPVLIINPEFTRDTMGKLIPMAAERKKIGTGIPIALQHLLFAQAYLIYTDVNSTRGFMYRDVLFDNKKSLSRRFFRGIGNLIGDADKMNLFNMPINPAPKEAKK